MIRRFGKKEGFYSLVPPAIVYGGAAFVIGYSMWPYFYYVKNQTVIVLGLFAGWRYGWLLINYLRAFIYAKIRFPRLKHRTEVLPEYSHYPDRIYFIIPSFKEEPWVSIESFQSIMSNLADVPCHATLVVSVGDDRAESLISWIYNAHPGKYKVQLVFQRQQHGKRIALGHSLRAVARHYRDEPNSVTIFMDGDSWLEPETLRRTLPFFSAFENLGAATTNEIAYIKSKSGWNKDWYNLKFGQRHILFQSHSLSNKVLTLTGRFSLFRTSIIVQEDFIRMVEHDTITHWKYGRFRFLMGDDKSTWFYLLKHQWNMLYIPDVVCYSLESRTDNFLRASVALPYRWFGNAMRNNGRALALGAKTTGIFIWLAILDQRLSMWTSLVGLFGAALLTLMKSFVYLPFYISWVLLVRIVQMSAIAFNGHPVSFRTIPLMLYNQWFGSFIKIRSYFYLADQRWTKGKVEKQTQQFQGINHPLARYMPAYTMFLAFAIFGTAMLVAEKALSVPGSAFFAGNATVHVIDASAYGVVPNDGIDDALALQTIIDRLDKTGPVTISLPAGILNFERPLVIRRSDITISGQGQERTRIVSSLRLPYRAVFEISGVLLEQAGTLAQPLKSNARKLTMNRATTLHSGDFVLLKMPNDAEFFSHLRSKVWKHQFPYLRQSIGKISATNSLEIDLERPTGIDFQDAMTTVHRVDAVRNVVLRSFSIEQTIPGTSISGLTHKYENAYPDYAVDGVSLNWTTNASLEGLSIINAGRHPINIENSYEFTMRDNLIDGSWNKGDKGNGYLRIARSYYGLITSCQVRNIRHITLQWSSAYNRLADLYTEVDLNFHGGYTHHNTVSDIASNIPEKHPWPAVQHTPINAAWAPPDGPDNRINGLADTTH